MKFTYSSFGQVQIDGEAYQRDMVLNNQTIEPRKKKNSRHLKAQFGHTPLGPEEKIPWDCIELVVGTGYYGSLPITEEVLQEAKKRGVALKIMKTALACQYLSEASSDTNAVLHITC
jgi:hypothetical protein